MGLIQDYLRKLRDKKADRENFADGRRMVESYDAKKMNANERELLRYKEEERQKRIKSQLESYRKRENDKVWSGRQGNPVYAKNMIKDKKDLFSDQELFKNNKNITAGNKCIFTNYRRVY